MLILSFGKYCHFPKLHFFQILEQTICLFETSFAHITFSEIILGKRIIEFFWYSIGTYGVVEVVKNTTIPPIVTDNQIENDTLVECNMALEANITSQVFIYIPIFF